MAKQTPTTTALQLIHAFFDSYSLVDALKEIEEAILAATDDQPWQGSNAYEVVYLFERVAELYQAALLLQQAKVTLKEAVLQEAEPDMAVHANFVGRNHFATVWNTFPRHLTKEHFCNPYLALKGFVNLMPAAKWKATLKELERYALSPEAIDESMPSNHVLHIRLQLLQLVEACHLLHVRLNSKPCTT